mgnify:FL=1
MGAVGKSKEEWREMDEWLLPLGLGYDLPQPECKGLSLLSEVMLRSRAFRRGSKPGLIEADYSDNILIVLDVAQTLIRRVRWNPSDSAFIDAHIMVHLLRTDNESRRDLCIVSNHDLPAVDNCLSFVMWAESGFPNPPETVTDGVAYLEDPAGYEERLQREREERAERRRAANEILNDEIERKNAELEVQQEIDLGIYRMNQKGWRELMEEHEISGSPQGRVSTALHEERTSLLAPPLNDP